jgi:hypothetical protein
LSLFSSSLRIHFLCIYPYVPNDSLWPKTEQKNNGDPIIILYCIVLEIMCFRHHGEIKYFPCFTLFFWVRAISASISLIFSINPILSIQSFSEVNEMFSTVFNDETISKVKETNPGKKSNRERERTNSTCCSLDGLGINNNNNSSYSYHVVMHIPLMTKRELITIVCWVDVGVF